MTGLEKIVEQIKEEAQAASEENLAQTKKEGEELLAEAKQKREEARAIAVKQIDADAKQRLLRGQSAAALQKRKLLLEAKQQIIKEILADALDTMLHLNQEEYFGFLLRMVRRYALKEPGTIYLSRLDLERMPESFRRELEEKNIMISEEPATLTGGFLLSYGDIEENCSFDALLAENRDALQDQLVKVLF